MVRVAMKLWLFVLIRLGIEMSKEFGFDNLNPDKSVKEILDYLLEELSSDEIKSIGGFATAKQVELLLQSADADCTEDQVLFLAASYGLAHINNLLLERVCKHGLKFADCGLCVSFKTSQRLNEKNPQAR